MLNLKNLLEKIVKFKKMPGKRFKFEKLNKKVVKLKKILKKFVTITKMVGKIVKFEKLENKIVEIKKITLKKFGSVKFEKFAIKTVKY